MSLINDEPPIATPEDYVPKRRSGSQQIPGLPGKKVADYWAWAYSDIMENIQRGTYAEFLVAYALGLEEDVRVGWRSYDLRYGDIRIEVKSSAYVQTWRTKRPSVITFGVAKRLTLGEETAEYGSVRGRSADVWVFAHFTPRAHPAGDVLDPNLWCFYVVGRAALEAKVGEQKTVGLATIKSLTSGVCLGRAKSEIDRVVAAQMK